MAKGYRISYPEKTTAWQVLEFEYTELGNEHIMADLNDFLGMARVDKSLSWRSTLGEFRRRHDDIQGVWLCPRVVDALTYYGRYMGDGAAILEYSYDLRNVVVDLGPNGFFVLDPKFVRERGVDPLEPLKRDLARVLRWPRRR